MRMPYLSMRARITLAGTAALAACLWALGAAGAFIPLGMGEVVTVAAATTVTLLDGLAFAVLAQRDRDKDLLLRCMAEFSLRAAKAPTRPLKRVV